MLAAKAIYDGVVFLVRNCGGVTVFPALAWLCPDSNRCTDHYGAETIPLCQWRYLLTDYFIK